MGRARGAFVIALALTACAEPAEQPETLETLDSLVAGSDAAEATGDGGAVSAPSDAVEAAAATAVDDPAGGSGFVSIQVRLAATGTDETLSLDRATVAAGELDPISLFASCTALDGGGGFVVSVTDLRRLASGDQLVALALTVADDVDAAGEFDATLDVADATQVSTTYTGTVKITRALNAGNFEVVDAEGNGATGTFTCSPESTPPSTEPPPLATPPETVASTDVTATTPAVPASSDSMPTVTIPATTAAVPTVAPTVMSTPTSPP